MDATLRLFPLNTVLVPGVALRLHIFEDRYKQMIGECIDQTAPFGVLLDRNGTETGDELDPVDVGTTAEIREVTRLPQGRLFIVTRGVRRFKTLSMVDKEPFLVGHVRYLDEPSGPTDAAQALRETAVERFKQYLQALLSISGQQLERVQLPDDVVAASYLIADALQVDTQAKQRLLESESATDRLRDELKILHDETQRIRAMQAVGSAAALKKRSAFAAKFSLN